MRKSKRGFWGKEFIEVKEFKKNRKAAERFAKELELQGSQTEISLAYMISDSKLETPLYTVHARKKKLGGFW